MRFLSLGRTLASLRANRFESSHCYHCSASDLSVCVGYHLVRPASELAIVCVCLVNLKLKLTTPTRRDDQGSYGLPTLPSQKCHPCGRAKSSVAKRLPRLQPPQLPPRYPSIPGSNQHQYRPGDTHTHTNKSYHSPGGSIDECRNDSVTVGPALHEEANQVNLNLECPNSRQSCCSSHHLCVNG